MQTSYLQYMVEIDRTRSITQAAANLFLTQPNLSRILHDVEAQLGYTIFERTSRGVVPTQTGVDFLRHARRILSELEDIEELGSRSRPPERFHVCMPRSAGILAMAAEYLNGLTGDAPLSAMLRECHVRRAFEYIASGEADLGIIRFRGEYRDYFEDRALEGGLSFEPLSRYRCRVVLRADHPAAGKPELRQEDLMGMTEITHGDTFRVKRSPGGPQSRSIYSVDRHAQLTLVGRIPNAFMWATPMASKDLVPWGLVQREIRDNYLEYQNAIIAIAPERLNDIEKGFMDYVRGKLGSREQGDPLSQLR